MRKIKNTIRLIIDVKKQYDRYLIGVYAAQGAFFVLISAVPLAMLTIVLLGMFAPLDLMGIRRILAEFFTQKANNYILTLLGELQQRATIPLLSVTMAFLLWAATRGVRSIAEGIGTIYGAQQYSTVQKAVRSGLYSVFMIIVSVGAVAVMVFAEEYFAMEQWYGTLYRHIILFCLLTFLFATAYKFLAKSNLSFKSQLWGGAFAAVGWIVYTFGYSVYIRHFSKYSLLYGSFGAVMLFMLWLYMCMNILLWGALLGKLKAEGIKCD